MGQVERQKTKAKVQKLKVHTRNTVPLPERPQPQRANRYKNLLSLDPESEKTCLFQIVKDIT